MHMCVCTYIQALKARRDSEKKVNGDLNTEQCFFWRTPTDIGVERACRIMRQSWE